MSELHDRLSHLVNYSSQLIFVSGNSVSEQQRTLNDFLSVQQEKTEISYFSASIEKQAQDYRRDICRQLAGHVVGSFVRPLNQLLNNKEGSFDTENGTYLVCITQAQNLSDSFLQELWDWVMESQQAQSKAHLNVLLFGESDWASKAQEWLPMQNKHKPVLLSSQSIDPNGFDVNALEALMADKHSWLSTSNQPIVTNKWFIGSVLSVFFVVFVGLMAWQYPNHVKTIFDSKNQTKEAAQSRNSERKKQSDNDEQDALIKSEGLISELANPEVVIPVAIILDTQAPQAVTPITQSLQSANKQSSKSITDELLVINWQQRQELKPSQDSQNNSVISIEPSTADTDRVAQVEKPALFAQNEDFAVPDIISVEELDLQMDEQASNIDGKIKHVSTDLYNRQSNLGTNDYKFDESTLLSLPTDTIVLQLSGIQNPSVLENYLKSNNLKENTWVYETQRYGGPWYVVLYNQSFDSIDAALKQRTRLPDDIREAQPFAKSISQIKREIGQR